ncbi:polyphosphate polymerase domain-containing protein [Marinagarivorans cellulosilyticus]|uniref:VTC domain-containing protein n=1 Tax=Marinagarivorans cellulosilyticus TaxID=2721545 RepID=A0AAN1WLN8_9GAMM|nr:polyphosphate polymerase domain-containing protein [Marinagarivorans cellulosilyticus]BCD99860.1 hypothetical protein MARGE09_P4062 [Marinagarivorans cellulosilyticus]
MTALAFDSFIREPTLFEAEIQKYSAHGLDDLKRAQLMNRIDTKFVVPTAVLPALLEQLRPHFSVLEIGNKRLSQYESTYFDTSEYYFYHQHHRGRLNRFKVRFREYVDTQTRFLEVKFKNNKKRTAKNRVAIKEDGLFDIRNHEDFLRELNVPQCHRLEPKLVNRYQRIALASEARAERLTIDINLENTVGSEYGQVALGDFAILELKQEKLTRNSVAFDVIRKLNLRPRGFSKYCMGLVMTLDSNEIKTNRFKKNARHIQLPTKEIDVQTCLA